MRMFFPTLTRDHDLDNMLRTPYNIAKIAVNLLQNRDGPVLQ